MRKNLYLLVRAYNDLDCRIPLIMEFANQGKYKISVICIPTNNGIGDLKNHELISVLQKANIQYKTIFDINNNHFIKLLFRLYSILKIDSNIVGRFVFRIKKYIFKIIVYFSYNYNSWFINIIKSFSNGIIIADEIVFHKNRSFFIDELLYHKDNYSIYSIFTGQNPFLNLWQNEENRIVVFKKFESKGIPFFVPSENDLRIIQINYPDENVITVGNTRFDSSWIEKLSSIAKEKIARDKVLNKAYKHNIVFMMAKIEYGVDLDNIIELINECSKIENALVILKPHTRGMTIDSWGHRLDNNVMDGSKYGSNELTEWSDTVLFTSSTIIFQAMMLHKKIVFLKYCQKYKTIFDKEPSICVAQNLQQTIDYVKKVSIDSIDTKGLDKFVRRHTQNSIPDGLVCKSVVNLIENIEGKTCA